MRRSILLLVLLATLFINNGSLAQEMGHEDSVGQGEQQNVVKGSRDSHNIPIFSQDVVFLNPSNRYSFFFDVRPGLLVSEESFVRIHFSFSNTLLVDKSSITLLLNDIPISGEFLSSYDSRTNRIIDIPLALEYIKEGVNELKIQTINRSLVDICDDYDNPANWLVIHKDSLLHLRVNNDPINRIRQYPYPFLNYLEDKTVASTMYLPENLDQHDIEALLAIASDWGTRESFKELVPIVRRGIPLETDSHQLYVGQLDNWQKTLRENYEIAGNDGAGAISYGEPIWEQYNRLLITGNNPVGLKRAVRFITNPVLVNQVHNQELVIDQDIPGTNTEDHLLPQSNNFFFSELGVSDIVLKGPFVQRSSFRFQKPLGVRLQKGSFIEIQFRHQQTTDYLRSSLTVEINGIPANSIPLSQGTSNNGVFRIEIPKSVLDSPSWFVEFIAFHDMANEDCQSLPEEVFWTFIDKTSRIHLITTPAESSPSLDGFPKVYTSYNKASASKAVIWLDENPSDVGLSIAAQIAIRTSQQLQEHLQWKVLLGDWDDKAMEEADYLFIVSSNPDNQRLKPIAHMLFAYYEGEVLQLRESMDLVRQEPTNLMLLQASKYIPNPAAIIYTILGTNDQLMMEQYHNLSEAEFIRKLNGSVAIIDEYGSLFTIYDENTKKTMLPSIAVPGWIDSRASTWNIFAAFLAVVILVAFITAWVALRKQKKIS